MNFRLVLLATVLVAFTVFSAYVTVQKGYFGFLTLAWNEPWGMQILLDLTIALVLLTGPLLEKGRKAGVSAWPWIVGILPLGSISALAFLVRVELAAKRAPAEDR